MIHEGEKVQSAFILAQGWACTFKMLPDGERQIVDFKVPGDFWVCAACCFAPPITASMP